MAKICLSVDDNAPENTKLAKLFKELEVPATFFLSAIDQKHGAMTPAKLYDLAQEFEIGSHTFSHQLLTRIEIKEARDEIQTGKEWVEYLTGKSCTKFVFPRGYKTDELVGMLPDLEIDYVRGVEVLDGGIAYYGKVTYDRPNVHVYQRDDYNGRSWWDIANEQLALADLPSGNGRVHVFMHSWEAERDGHMDKLKYWIKSRKERGHKFVSIDESLHTS